MKRCARHEEGVAFLGVTPLTESLEIPHLADRDTCYWLAR